MKETVPQAKVCHQDEICQIEFEWESNLNRLLLLMKSDDIIKLL